MRRGQNPPYEQFGEWRPSVEATGWQRYDFICCICQKPGVSEMPRTKTHPQCKAERKKRVQARYIARKKARAKLDGRP